MRNQFDMSLDNWCAYYTFQSIFSLACTIGYGTWVLLSPSKAGDQTFMIVLGMITLVTFAMRVHLGAQRDREREEKESK